VWKKKYSGLGLSELRELRQLREENAKLKTQRGTALGEMQDVTKRPLPF
jgi:hypothetical protein